MTGRLPDERDRRRAASAFDENLIVRAGAGTGKTELLVERILTAVGWGRIEIEQLAALTFTEKAAGEMRERLAVGLERLRALASGEARGGGSGASGRVFAFLTGEQNVSAAEIGPRALRALTSLDRASITTIHSFCAELLREYPREANVDPTFRVDPGEHFRAAFEEEWTRFLSRELATTDRPEAERWTRLLEELGAVELRAIAAELCAFSFPKALLARPYEREDARAFLSESVGELCERLRRAEAASGLTDTNQQFLAWARAALERFLGAGLPEFAAFFEERPEARERILKTGTKMGTKVAGIGKSEFAAVVRDSTRIIGSLLAIDDELIGRAYGELARFAQSFRETYLTRGLVSFDGLLHLTRDLLAEHPEVRRAVRRKFRTLLVDEFQDTDPVQYEIVLFLAETDDGHADDAFAAGLQPGRLFVVGDAKQSIYRFRGADYAAFRRAADRINAEGGGAAGLTANFRSVPGVLDAVNRMMSPERGVWTESAYLPAYEPVRAIRDGAGPAVELWTVRPDGPSAAARRAAEGAAIAERIRAWVDTESPCRYGDITVLFRSFSQLSRYLKPLRRAGIPFVVDGGRGFADRPEVGQLLAILRALASPSDGAALLAYLRSPAGGVPDTELAGYAAAGGAWDWRDPAGAAPFPALDAALARLREIDAATRELPIDARVREAVRRTDLLALSAASFDGAQRVANLRKLVRLTANLARDGKLSEREVLDALADEQVSQNEADSPLADDGADAVRILTIHKAKGLENKRVILADAAREDRGARDSARGRVAQAGGRAWPAIRAGARINPARAWLDDEERRHDEAEELRVLYVALTRARDRLAILVAPSRGTVPWMEAFRAWDYDSAAPPPDGALLAGGLVHHRVIAQGEPEAAAARPVTDVDGAVARYRAAIESLAGAQPAVSRSPSGDEAGPVGGAGIEDRQRAKAAGTVVHELLRRWSLGSDEELTVPLPAVASTAAEDAGIASAAVAREAEAILRGFLRSDLPARLRSAKLLGREVPMIFLEDRTLWPGTIDLLIEEAGEIVVVDFKTGRETGRAELIERYGGQVGVYARAVKAALGLPRAPRAELWLVREGLAVPVE